MLRAQVGTVFTAKKVGVGTGYVSLAAKRGCQSCASGKYATAAQQAAAPHQLEASACTSCEAGKWTAASKDTDGCTACAAGKFYPATGLTLDGCILSAPSRGG